MKQDHSTVIEKIKKETRDLLERKPPPGQIYSKITFLSIVIANLRNNEVLTKRGVYYCAVNVFGTQRRVDLLIACYTKKFQCSMGCLNIEAGVKGLFHGNLRIQMGGVEKELNGTNLVPNMSHGVEIVSFEYPRVLIIEKETIFNRLTHPGIFTICGKGFPDENTLKFIRSLPEETEFLCLTDFDPHGLHIWLNYHRSRFCTRIGVDQNLLFEYKIHSTATIPLTEKEINMLKTLRSTECRDAALFLLGVSFKVEIEAVFESDKFDKVEFIENLINK